MSPNQRGSAIAKVMVKWLVAVKVYEVSPIELLIAIKIKIEVNMMIADFFPCKIIKNSLEINNSILLRIVLFVVLMFQNEIGRKIRNRNILIQLEIIVLEDGSKIENKFLIIFSYFDWFLFLLLKF